MDMKLAIVFALVSIAVHAATSGANSGDWIRDVREAAQLDRSARYAEAQAIYDRILPLVSSLSETDLLRAEFANDLAAHYHHLARYTDAEPLYRQAITIWRQVPGSASRQDLA